MHLLTEQSPEVRKGPGNLLPARDSNQKPVWARGKPAVIPQAVDQHLSDEEVIARVGRGEVALFEVVMRRYNQRLYRTARAITGDDRRPRTWCRKPTCAPTATS